MEDVKMKGDFERFYVRKYVYSPAGCLNIRNADGTYSPPDRDYQQIQDQRAFEAWQAALDSLPRMSESELSAMLHKEISHWWLCRERAVVTPPLDEAITKVLISHFPHILRSKQ